MYRKDVLGRIDYIMNDENFETPPCFAKVAREMGCDWRTVKKAYERSMAGAADKEPTRKKGPSKLDPYKDIVAQKAEKHCKAMAIFKFIQKKGYEGGYTTVRNYVNSLAEARAKAAVMRFETMPGLQAQVDWKESMTIRGRDGTPIKFNIFLMVMGYSRAKYIELTLDRSQPTLMRCMLNAFSYFGGAPSEVLFDNMKTVADRAKSEYGRGVVNAAFDSFAKDCLFEPLLCKAFSPATKGKAEDLAKLMERLRVYDGEVDDKTDMSRTVDELRDDLNGEVSQATGMRPVEMLAREKEYLHMPDVEAMVRQHVNKPIMRRVSRESTVVFEGCKYSVRPRFIGKMVEVRPENGFLSIYLSKDIISTHRITGKRFSYKRDDYIEIMKSNAFKDVPDDVIERVAEQNLSYYDTLG